MIPSGKHRVYISNLPITATIVDVTNLYAKYGPIKRIKFFNQYFFQNSFTAQEEICIPYPIGVAVIEYTLSASAEQCLRDQTPKIISGNILQTLRNPNSISNQYKKSIFLFFKSPSQDVDSISKVFKSKNFPFQSIKILHPASYGKDPLPGMAIINIGDSNLRESAIVNLSSPGFQLCHPMFDIEALNFTDQDPDIPAIVSTPILNNIPNRIQFNRWFDFEIRHLNNSYYVNSLLASQYSSRIKEQVLQNTEKNLTNNYLEIPIDIPGPFDLIVDTLNGRQIRICPDNAVFLLLCSDYLGIQTLKSATLHLINDFTDPSLAFYFVQELYKHNLPLDKHIDYIATNISKFLEGQQLKSLPHEIIRQVLIRLSENHSESKELSKWLLEFCKKDKSAHAILMPYLIKYSSSMNSQQVRQMIKEPGANLAAIRESLSSILGFGAVYDINFNPQNPDFGIFGFLQKGSRFPVYDIVDIQGSSNVNTILDHPSSTGNDCYTSPPIENMWIQFDLGKIEFVVKAYSIMNGLSRDSPHLRQWRLDGSNDEEKWQTIHSISDANVLKGKGKMGTWKCDKNVQPFRYIRLVQTGANSRNNFCLSFKSIEFYGQSTDDKSPFNFPYKQGHEWNGLVNYLRTNSKHKNRITIKTACDPFHLVDPNFYKNGGMWASPAVSFIKEPFIMFGFGNIHVEVKQYRLRSGEGPNFMTNWVLEGCDDSGSVWNVIDSRKNQNELSQRFAVNNFITTKTGSYNKLRLRMNGPNKAKQNVLCLSQIEFYGIISGANQYFKEEVRK
ncbi:F5/8 type C domain containing protein [Histomonas meleagridis]|uniref:F5/8 type C domain containing protein n=1 Tax=Histomonas meleagridis TaxID=135588 RepID=UPI00355939D5|nr:F5/8 type C domain containing protein [Histomonas meleagridis]KAH0806891.1 F5/8 type C domain containing protein [Histomonas meleagridis]